jgi:hypothetical protein
MEEDIEDKDVHMPIPEEIKICCEKIQKTWSKHKLASRLVVPTADSSISVIDTSGLPPQLRMLASDIKVG